MKPIKVTCHKCNHEWQYKGSMRPTVKYNVNVTCPRCSYKVALAKIKEEVK